MFLISVGGGDLDEYKKIRRNTDAYYERKGVSKEDRQPGHMRIWRDPLNRPGYPGYEPPEK